MSACSIHRAALSLGAEMIAASRRFWGRAIGHWRFAALLKAVVGLAAPISLAACSAAAPGSALSPEADDRPISRSADYAATGRPKLISLNPCIDAILVAIAPRDQVLALSHYSRNPGSSSIPESALQSYRFTGGTAEEVLAASPDLVLASTFIDPSTRSAFERLGMAVATFGSPVSLAESIAQVRRVAQITGNQAAGERLVAEMEQAAAPSSPDARPITALLWQPGQIVPGEATLIADLMRRHGFVSHSAASGLGQADFVSLERLLDDPPEVVLVAGDSTGQRHPLLQRLETTRVEPFAGWLINCGGPSVIAASERLRAVRAGIE